MRSRRAFVSKSRQAGLTDFEARKAWVLLLGQAAATASRVLTGAPVDRFEGAAFAGQVVRMRAPFPQRHVTAQAAAEAFLILARAFADAGFSAALAGFLAEGARTLSEMLDAETRAAFARSCAAVGDD